MKTQLIKGSDVTICGEMPETVSNVLIGQANGRSCTLGIPKGDTHQWADKKLKFFGRYYRTVGLPEEGEPQNIPLAWGKNIRAELLPPMRPCTVYEGQSKARHVFYDTEMTDTRGRTLSASGAVRENNMRVKIYSHNTERYIPKAGDIIIAGECEFIFGTGTEQSESASMAQLRALCPDLAFVVSNELTLNGLLYDMNILAG
ncbi:MAG: hypothetical protein IJ740_08195 [Ruminococcus sp.]|nr:hypothetical protein [Ruminococcus sp.]